MNDDQVDHSRRHLLTAATAGIGAVGVVFAAVPFIASWQPSERAKALGCHDAMNGTAANTIPTAPMPVVAAVSKCRRLWST